MHIIRHCLLFRTRFPSGLYRTLPSFHQSQDLEDALDREIGGTAPVARDAFHLVSIHSKCNHMFLRMSSYAYWTVWNMSESYGKFWIDMESFGPYA